MGISHISAHQFGQEVLQSEKLLLVDFWATWCGPCVAMAPILEDIARAFPREIQIVKIDVDNEEELARQFSIRSIPTILFFKNGKIVDNLVGKVSKELIVNKINKALVK